MTLTILQNGESTYTHPINEMIQSMLGEAGIKAEIKNMDMTSYWDTIASGEGYSISLGPVTADVPDPGASSQHLQWKIALRMDITSKTKR